MFVEPLSLQRAFAHGSHLRNRFIDMAIQKRFATGIGGQVDRQGKIDFLATPQIFHD